jgi:hypothetical protein
MGSKNKETLDIVKLIENNPNTKLSKDYENKMISKIKKEFTEPQQQLFVGSFYCHLKFDAKDDFVIDLDDVWKWIGFTRKDNAKRLLEKFFIEDRDYKVSPIQSEKKTQIEVFLQKEENPKLSKLDDNKGGRPNEQILMTVNTFKKFCLKAGTKKADEIHDYYIKLEELLQETINDETNELKNQLLLKDNQILIKDKQHKNDLKMKKHDTLINLMKAKKSVYLGEIEENKFIKVGSSDEVDCRIKRLNDVYENMIFLEIFECVHFREIEENILKDPIILKHLYRDPIKLDGSVSFEVVELSSKFTYNDLLNIVKKHVAKDETYSMNPTQLLEKQKMDLEKQKLDLEKQKLDFCLIYAVLNNDKYSDDARKIVKDTIPNMLKNSFINNKLLNEKQIEKNDSNNDNDNDNYNDDNSDSNSDAEIKNNNLNNDISLEINRNIRSAQGRKIQKIDPNDITKVITVYDSMMYLLRCPEYAQVKRSQILEAIENNTIFKDYRWNFVEKGEDQNISKAEPTNLDKKKYNSNVVLQLNETKTKILNSYMTKIKLLNELGITKRKLNKIIENGLKFNSHYYVLSQNCPEVLLKEYKGSTIRSIKKCLIKQINPISKSELIFNTFGEISTKLGFKAQSIQKAIKNKTMYGGSIWELCEKIQ